MNKKVYNIGIIGAGGWGTTLALVLNENRHKVTLWTYEKQVCDEINLNHTNSIFLRGIQIPSEIKSTTNPEDFEDNDLIILAVPTQFIRSVLKTYSFPIQKKLLVSVAKGIEKNTLMRVSEIISDAIDFPNENYAILTGPSHAEEVSRKTPTTVVVASDNYDNCKQIQQIFSTPYFRIYSSDDVIGCELGGALKNVIAIAAGIVDGLELGDNAKAALMTRGLAGITRLGIALGAKAHTFSGLSGLGDLYVTCSSRHSRNRYVGEQIGRGRTLSDILKEMQMVAEGIFTTESAFHLGKKHNVEMAITEQMHQILFEDKNPLSAINYLMTRESKREWWW